MSWNPIAVGLGLAIIGFLLVFAFGGFERGRSTLLLEDDKSNKAKPFKILGAVMIIAGFVLQLYGAVK